MVTHAPAKPSSSASMTDFNLSRLAGDHCDALLEQGATFAIAQLDVVGSRSKSEPLELFRLTRVATVNVSRSVLSRETGNKGGLPCS